MVSSTDQMPIAHNMSSSVKPFCSRTFCSKAGKAGIAGCPMLVAVVGTAGCLRWVEIKPTELPKLNGSYARTTGAVPTPTGPTMIVERTVAHIERPDGTLVEISGRFHADVSTSAGSLRFEHPVNSELQNDVLVIQGGNRAQTPIPLPAGDRIQLTLKQTIELTLQNVLDLDVAAYTLEESKFGILAARGIFDPNFEVDLGLSDTQNATASKIQASETKIAYGNASLNGLLIRRQLA